jgi:hypothetical protein
MDQTARTEHVFRVTVRGRFSGLTDDARAELTAGLVDHDVLGSQFTPEGTLSYDARLDFFNLRYEVRLDDQPSTEDAGVVGLVEAEQHLARRGLGHGELRVEVMDVTAMTSRTRRA